MALKYNIEKHGVCFPSNTLALHGGKHVYNLVMDKARDNGEVVTLGDWQGMQKFAVTDAGSLTEGIVLEQAVNGNWYVRITKCDPTELLVCSIPLEAEQYTRDWEKECYSYNEAGDVARGIELAVGDIIELSAENFGTAAGQPEAKKVVKYVAATKWTVQA